MVEDFFPPSPSSIEEEDETLAQRANFEARAAWVDPRKVFKDRVRAAAVLSTIPFFADHDAEYLDAVVEAMELQVWDEGQTLIFDEGTRATRLYINVSGVVSICKLSPDKGWPEERELLDELRWFGIEALTDAENVRYGTSAIAVEQATVLMLDCQRHRQRGGILQKNPREIIIAARERKAREAAAKIGVKMRIELREKRHRKAQPGTVSAAKPVPDH